MTSNDFVLPFQKSIGRPIIRLENNDTALIDLGATMPVWTSELESLIQDYNAKKRKTNCPCKWYGGKMYGDMYRVPFLKIGNLIYPEFPCLVISNSEFTFDWIIPALAFNGLRLEFDFRRNKMSVIIPEGEQLQRHLLVDPSMANELYANLE